MVSVESNATIGSKINNNRQYIFFFLQLVRSTVDNLNGLHLILNQKILNASKSFIFLLKCITQKPKTY